jgi:hypothetical protein
MESETIARDILQLLEAWQYGGAIVGFQGTPIFKFISGHVTDDPDFRQKSLNEISAELSTLADHDGSAIGQVAWSEYAPGEIRIMFGLYADYTSDPWARDILDWVTKDLLARLKARGIETKLLGPETV